MDLSIIIVNWNSKEYLRKCIASIYATIQSIEYEIIVIDNASFDGCDQMLRSTTPDSIIRSNHNLGFAKANNITFRESWTVPSVLEPGHRTRHSAVNIMFHYLQRLPLPAL
jgi:GT2 family glycosyltransferase